MQGWLPLLLAISIQFSLPLHPTIPILASRYLKGGGSDVVTAFKDLLELSGKAKGPGAVDERGRRWVVGWRRQRT